MLLNVFDPVILKSPAKRPVPPWLIVQLNVDPPPTNVLAVCPVREIVPVPVPAVVENPVGAALLNDVVLEPVIIIVPPLNVRFFVPALVANLVGQVKVFPFKSNVPFVRVHA